MWSQSGSCGGCGAFAPDPAGSRASTLPSSRVAQRRGDLHPQPPVPACSQFRTIAALPAAPRNDGGEGFVFAGLATGLWSRDDLRAFSRIERVFEPQLDAATRDRQYHGWKEAVRRCMNWERDARG